MKKKRSSPEHDEQKRLMLMCAMYQLQYPCLRWLHAIPNGAYRNIVTAARLKAEGVKSGVFDLFLPFAAKKYHGLYIEMKIKPNKMTETQVQFSNYADWAGYKTSLCFNADEAMKIILEYLN